MSDCPYCSWPNCYNSGFTVECANPECNCYSLKQCLEFVEKSISDGMKPMGLSTLHDCQILYFLIPDGMKEESLKNFVTEEVRRRTLDALQGKELSPWPEGVIAEISGPDTVNLTWAEYQVSWNVIF